MKHWHSILFPIATVIISTTSFAHHSDNIRTGAHYFELPPSRWVTALLDVLVLYINTTSYPTHKLAYHMQQICRFCKKMLLVYHIQVHCMLSQENSIIVDSVKTQFIINNFVGNTHLTDIRFM